MVVWSSKTGKKRIGREIERVFDYVLRTLFDKNGDGRCCSRPIVRPIRTC